ncbi:MAG: hypothetical protein JWP69_1540 [Flaviaesturariibacter sp.]|nr:hypothetical protein [Flaviaesturariibacter sp.]
MECSKNRTNFNVWRTNQQSITHLFKHSLFPHRNSANRAIFQTKGTTSPQFTTHICHRTINIRQFPMTVRWITSAIWRFTTHIRSFPTNIRSVTTHIRQSTSTIRLFTTIIRPFTMMIWQITSSSRHFTRHIRRSATLIRVFAMTTC